MIRQCENDLMLLFVRFLLFNFVVIHWCWPFRYNMIRKRYGAFYSMRWLLLLILDAYVEHSCNNEMQNNDHITTQKPGIESYFSYPMEQCIKFPPNMLSEQSLCTHIHTQCRNKRKKTRKSRSCMYSPLQIQNE